jgi:HD-like signal output (HDOD) protein
MTAITVRGGDQQDALALRLESHLESAALELPLLPDVASRILELCGDESKDAGDVARTLHGDPALAGHVLRVANSAAYAPGEEIVSLQQAVGRLGLRAVADIAVAVALRTRTFRVRGHEAVLRSVWAHSAMAGAWAREIARMRRRNVEGALLAGLLHDVGRPIVLQAALDLAGELELPAEPARLAAWMDALHPHAGARLAASWSLPEWMADVALWHHRPEEAPRNKDQVRTGCLADLLAHWSAAPSEATERALFESPAVAALGIYKDELEELCALRARVAELAEALA